MKIQVLELPLETNGEYSRTPYALIISNAEDLAAVDAIEKLHKIEGGPAWVIATKYEVEL